MTHLPECVNCRKVESAQRDEAYALRQALSDHLPECSYSPGQPGFGGINSGIPSTQPYFSPSPCICDRLRACEQRVLTEAPVSVFAKAFHDGQSVGFDKGVQAAREAVAAMAEGGLVLVVDALAAIDGLRGES